MHFLTKVQQIKIRKNEQKIRQTEGKKEKIKSKNENVVFYKKKSLVVLHYLISSHRLPSPSHSSVHLSFLLKIKIKIKCQIKTPNVNIP
jgi:hypothetical protein